MIHLEQTRHSSRPFRTHIHFGFWHTELNPDSISLDLGILPTDSYRKGVAIEKNVLHHRPTGHWGISSEGIVESWNVDSHVTWLIEQMRGKVEKIKSYRTQGYEIAMRICWVDRGGTGGPSLSAENVEELAALRTCLNMDWYEADPGDRFSESGETA
jgi:Domain of unknown function (DUF4279)